MARKKAKRKVAKKAVSKKVSARKKAPRKTTKKLKITDPDIEAEVLEEIDTLIVKNPFSSKYRIVSMITKKHNICIPTANKLFVQVADRRKQAINEIDITLEATEFAKAMRLIEVEYWKIVDSKDEETKDRMKAMQNIINNRKKMFDVLMDSGIIVRQLGTKKVLNAVVGNIEMQSSDVNIREKFNSLRDHVNERMKQAGLK